jgi:hypothetical protein
MGPSPLLKNRRGVLIQLQVVEPNILVRADGVISGRHYSAKERRYERHEHTMRAAVVTDFHSPLQIKDLPVPEPGAGEVLVQIETSGLCHTDIHAAHGDWPLKPTPPFIPGHEGVGHVRKLGTGVSNRAVGDRVAIAWLGYACGECRYCNDGWETLCEKQQNSGYSVNGTFAEYATVPAAFASPVPDGISSRAAADEMTNPRPAILPPAQSCGLSEGADPAASSVLNGATRTRESPGPRQPPERFGLTRGRPDERGVTSATVRRQPGPAP